MNKKQLLFCKYYIETDNLKIATEKSGYKEKTGEKLLQNPEIKKYIENNKKNIKIAKSDEVIECLTRIMRGEEYENKKSLQSISIKERLKAAELLGKVYSIFSPKQDNNDKENKIFILGNDLIEE